MVTLGFRVLRGLLEGEMQMIEISILLVEWLVSASLNDWKFSSIVSGHCMY